MHPIFKTFSTFNHCYVYDRYSNSIISLSQEHYDLLHQWECGNKSDAAGRLLEKMRSKGYLLDNPVEVVRAPYSDYYDEILSRRTEQVTLQITQDCNLRCDYCVYNGAYDNRACSKKEMSFDVAKRAIDYIFSHSCEMSSIAIAFYGGEPLLRLDLILQCVDYVKETYPEKPVLYTLTTNGTLLSDRVVELLFSRNINIMISLDGTKEMHDAHRVFATGAGSFDLIMKNLVHIKEKHPDYYKKISINTVLSPSSDFTCLKTFYDTDDVMDFFNPQYSLLSDHNAKTRIKYGEDYIIASRTELLKCLLWTIEKIPATMVSNLFKAQRGMYLRTHKHLAPIQGLPSICHPGGPCMAGAKRIFCDVDGNLFPCERVSEMSEIMKIGDLQSGVDIDKALRLVNVGEITAEACKRCWAFVHCTQCAAVADDTHTLVKERRLERCAGVQRSLIESFMDNCFLVEQGVDFDELEDANNGE